VKQKGRTGGKAATIVGVGLGWSLRPQLAFSDGTVYFKASLDFIFHSEYFPGGPGCWPRDPTTGKKLEAVS
jgi:hypothetical protein